MRALLSYDDWDLSGAITEAMAKIIEKVTPQTLSYPYSESNLVCLMTRGIQKGHYADTGVEWVHNGEINAAIVLADIVRKIGKILQDEAEIIRTMLGVDWNCEVGARLVADTFDHPWRSRVKDTGIIESLCYNSINQHGFGSCYYRYSIDSVLANLLYGIGKATELNQKEKVDTDYIYNSDLIKALVICSKKENEIIRNNTFFFMQVISSISSFADKEFEPVFVEGVINDSVSGVRRWSMEGIKHVLDRRKIKDHRLEKALQSLVDHNDPKVRATALRTIGKYLEVSSFE